MKPIRVLIADGSSTARQIINRTLARDPELDVISSCSSGRTTLAKIAELRPDVIVLEVDLPELNGLQTLAELRYIDSVVPVIMLSRQTTRGSNATIEALMHGATAYVTKPEKDSELERCVERELIPRIKHLAIATATVSSTELSATGGSQDRPAMTAQPVTRRQVQHVQPAEIVAIATSTGGPNALTTLLSALPQSFAVPIVIVQHMPEGFTKALAESLTRQTGRLVREVDSCLPISAASVWLAKGGQHLVLNRERFAIQVVSQHGPPENDCCPSADVMFRSVAEIYGARVLAVMLTGMGCDGLAGCRAIRAAGGTVIAQDEASSTAWGMPGQVVSAGLADVVLPLDRIAAEVILRTSGSRSTHRSQRVET